MNRAAIALVAVWASAASAQETVWLELESGSRLTATWSTPELAIEADGARTAIPPAAVVRLVPGVWYDGETIARVDALVADLGADDYSARQAASAALPAFGWLAASRLEPLRNSPDPEIAARAAAILERVEAGEGHDHPAPRPDRVETADAAFEGRLQPGIAAFRWRGAELTLAWDEVRSVARTRGQATRTDPPPTAFRRLEPDDFAAADRTLDFDRDASGNPIAAGSDVELAYADLGVVLDTEVEGSVVHADGFVVSGRSRGNSAATRDPRWEGDVRLAFFQPGTLDRSSRRGIPGGVHRLGVHVADVSPGGTGLRAWSADGRMLQEVKTDGRSTDFLGLESPVPIHRVEVFDDPAIDSNFTTDDFVFGPIVAPGADPDRFVLDLAGGERLVVPAFAGDENGLSVVPAPGGPEVRLPARELTSIHAPTGRLAWGREGGVRWLGPGDGVVSLSGDGVVVDHGGRPESLGWDAVAAVRFGKEDE